MCDTHAYINTTNRSLLKVSFDVHRFLFIYIGLLWFTYVSIDSHRSLLMYIGLFCVLWIICRCHIKMPIAPLLSHSRCDTCKSFTGHKRDLCKSKETYNRDLVADRITTILLHVYTHTCVCACVCVCVCLCVYFSAKEWLIPMCRSTILIVLTFMVI